jgi:hypothetical protein
MLSPPPRFKNILILRPYTLYRRVLFICRQPRRHLMCIDSELCNVSVAPFRPSCSCTDLALSILSPHAGHCGFLLGTWTLACLVTRPPRRQPCTDRSSLLRPSTYVCIRLCLAIISSWRTKWSNAYGNKLRVVKPSVQVWQSFRGVRKDEVTHPSLDRSHTPGKRTFIARRVGACLYKLRCPSYCGTYLGAQLALL